MSLGVNSVWCTFLPRGLSIPPATTPPLVCNSALLCNAPGFGCVSPFNDSQYFGENFCPYVVGNGDDLVALWDARYAANPDTGYDYDGYFYDVDVEDYGWPRGWTIGNGPNFNGGHNYIESYFPVGYSASDPYKAWYVDVYQNFGPQPNGAGELAGKFWRDNAAGSGSPSVYGPYSATARIVVQWSAGFILDDYAYLSLLYIEGLDGPWMLGGDTNLIIQTRPPGGPGGVYADGLQRLWLNFDDANSGVPIHLGLASDLFDGLPHEFKLTCERNGNMDGSYRVTVEKDGSVLYTGTVPGDMPPTTGPEYMYFPWHAEFMENTGVIKNPGTPPLTVPQWYRVYELEFSSVGMPTVGP